ncbi:uncharacterized protein LOC128388966 isoform X2 [Panonychus citri]|uniref:uncharacterized protein LOC128388966 isoform X2 n=1 Tax=Panonychus citri TaxID=50023 RepID=UPI0023075716|nr:uncharacterized protein LOC128388966 isoform X2 [Panonychus citri]
MPSSSQSSRIKRSLRVTKFGSSVNELLRSQTLHLPQTIGDLKTNIGQYWFPMLTLINLIVNTIKFSTLIMINPTSDLILILGDPSHFLGESRLYLLTLNFIWCVIACIHGVHFVAHTMCPVSSAQKTWLCIGEILETGQYKKWGHFDDLAKQFRRLVKANTWLITSAYFFFLSLLPVFKAPRQFIFPMSVNLFLNTWCCYYIMTLSINFVFIYVLYAYVWIEYLKFLTVTTLTINVHPNEGEPLTIENDDFIPGKRIRFIVTHFTEHFQEFIFSDLFHGIKNSLNFLVTFIAYIIIVFLIFFTSIPSSIKVAMICCGISGSFFGHYIQFLIGIYGQSQLIETFLQSWAH